MRKLIALLLLPVIGQAQTNNVISVSRYFPKADKVQQFEKALTAHAQKYHAGDVKWRVFTIETGPDAGGYQVVEGPKSWESEDKRGDLGKAHMDDWTNAVQTTLSDKTSTMYMTFRTDLSTVDQTAYSDKIAVEHVFINPGYYSEVEESIAGMKKVWEQSNQTIAVYDIASSGYPQFAIVTRYKEGLKERDAGFRAPLKERYIKAYSENAWKKMIDMRRSSVKETWSEMLFYAPELSSK